MALAGIQDYIWGDLHLKTLTFPVGESLDLKKSFEFQHYFMVFDVVINLKLFCFILQFSTIQAFSLYLT